jgi:hypothetical protein
VTDVPTTPSEGDPQDLGKHYADVQSAPLNLSPEDQERIAQAIEQDERELAEGPPASLESALKDMPTADDLKARPAFILSEVDVNHPSGRGLVLGWDTCGECHMHIRVCLCANGPHRPRYVETWYQQNEAANARAAERAAEREARTAKVEADPTEVEARVQEVLEDTTPTGRKKRSDAGKPRGPRKKADATPESVLEAAGDLSAAMKDS